MMHGNSDIKNSLQILATHVTVIRTMWIFIFILYRNNEWGRSELRKILPLRYSSFLPSWKTPIYN